MIWQLGSKARNLILNLKMNALQQQNQVVNSETDPYVLKALQGHKEKVTSATLHPNLKQVISSSNDGLILAW